MDSSILIVFIILSATILLLVFEIFRIDVTAMICLLALGWSGVLSAQEVMSGFSSNAVIAMMAVMMMGRGISRTGFMHLFSNIVLKKVGTNRFKINGFLSLSVGMLSGFIQNIGAVALFLPGILDISRRAKIPVSLLIMPVGFAAILGGTLSMVGSGPLILINDLLRHAELEPFSLFSTTPVGIVLLLSGILYFTLFGRYVLPIAAEHPSAASEQEKLIESLHLPHHIAHFIIPKESELIDKTPEDAGIWKEFNLNILAVSHGRDVEYAPWRETRFESNQKLALLGREEDIGRFVSTYGLLGIEQPRWVEGLSDPVISGFAEVIVPPRSEILNRTIREFSFRKRYAVEPIMLISRGEDIIGDFSDHVVIAGDIFIVFGLWDKISELKASPDFVVTTPFLDERKDISKGAMAIGCFILAIILAFTGAPISMAFLTGAISMILTRVLSIQEAYQAIEWKVVFLLAGLIPLGVAMQKTGATAFLADALMGVVQEKHPVFVLSSIALLSTGFSLVISNIGAVVVLAPLVIKMAEIGGLDPRLLALLSAVCASNSFILPTHQVNALLMSSGGYSNRDYLKAGGGMTVIFLLVVIAVFYFFFI